jgi:hypothetical protein
VLVADQVELAAQERMERVGHSETSTLSSRIGWYLNNTTGQWDSCTVGFDMNAAEAWDLCDHAGTKIGIVDHPLNERHEDLAPCIDASLCSSFVGGNPPLPWGTGGASDHGNLVAGLAAAGTDNDGIGIASISNLSGSHADRIIVALRVVPDDLLGSDDTTCAATFRALSYVCGPIVDGRIGVLNMSCGNERWKYCYDYNRTQRNACRNAFRYGISLVCSAGNYRTLEFLPPPHTNCADPDTELTYPAAFPDYALAVAGVNCTGRVNPAFMAGSYVDVAGPGEGVWVCTADTSGYSYIHGPYGWGTSFSSPVVAGAVALLLGANAELTNEDCYSLLRLMANPVDGRSAVQVGAGIPDLDRALTWLVPPCGVVHDSIRTTSYDADSLGQWSVRLMNVEGVNHTTETWQDFQVVPYRVTVQVQLPIHTHVLQVWPRGSRSAGWRLIDDQLDGNPIPHYDALFYDNWARTVGWGGGQQCTFECYTYKVLGDTIRWVPFQVGDDYWLNYSYVACESLPGSADDGNERSDVALRVLGSPVACHIILLPRVRLSSVTG